MKMRLIGNPGIEVSAIGLGCWGMSGAYGSSDRQEALATIDLAIGEGINFLDTADVYGEGHNEQLVAEAIRGRRPAVVLATKFGFVGSESGELDVCGRPDYVRRACEASLQRLGTDYIDLYYLHRIDPEVPVEETVGAMARLVEEGKVRFLGLSEVTGSTLKRAAAVHPIAALQSEYSLTTRDIEDEVIPVCRELGIAIVPFSPLGRGLLTGSIRSGSDLEGGDYRKNLPRFSDKNLAANLRLVKVTEEIAAAKRVKPTQIALAWLLQQGGDIIPIPGMKRPRYVRENIGSCNIVLSTEELSQLNVISEQVAGARYGDTGARFVDHSG
ncbi:MAG: aldo/keto reductase [Bacteroidales bacterium]|nr:aldo/keto reductase [Bacteroidales bacterium]